MVLQRTVAFRGSRRVTNSTPCVRWRGSVGSQNWGGGVAQGRMVGFASCKPADALVLVLFAFVVLGL